MSVKRKDIIIIGGGLAGLSLAQQIKSSQNDVEILVVEKNTFPQPEKTAKVGESTVEIGSHYLTEKLGLTDHFKQRHLRKHGLRCYFGEPQDDFSQQDELGISQLFGVPTYQIDRGAIENHLHERIVSSGVEVIDDASISDIQITDERKSLCVNSPKLNINNQVYSSRWVVDAAGRQAVLKNKLGLAKENQHKGNAVWFRIDRQIMLDDWSDNQEWQQRIKPAGSRWLATNHLMGPGYWVWIIPLDNGATSIGVVMDNQLMSENDFTSYQSAFEWLQKNHPKCAQEIEGADVLDYVVIKDYALNCKQMFSDNGWGLTGESAVFADPFYSPGSDFIAFNNTFISELISQEMSGQDIRFNSRFYQTINQSFFDNTQLLYTGQYGGFGDRRMMALKLAWDYAYYWGVLSLLYFKSAITDAQLMRELNPCLRIAQLANQNVQSAFRERASQRLRLKSQGLFLDQYTLPFLRHFNEQLQTNNGSNIQVALAENVVKLERISVYVLDMLKDNGTRGVSDDERSLFADYRMMVTA